MIYAIKLLFMVLLTIMIASRVLRPAFDGLLSRRDYRLAWMQIVFASIAAYLCKFPPLFLLVMSAVAAAGVSSAARGVVGSLAIFVLLTIVAPPIDFTLGGLGDVNYVLRLTPQRVLTLVLLLPAALRVVAETKSASTAGLRTCDWLIVAYQILRIVFVAPYSSVTTIARTGFEEAIDILLPYYVLSRGLRNTADLRHVATFAMIGLVFAGSVAITECLTQHNLYSGLQGVYGIRWQLTYVLTRGGLIRVQAMTPQPIVLAFAMTFGLGLWVWLKGRQWRERSALVVFGVLIVALIGTFSRGPWLAAGSLFLALLGLARLSPKGFGFLLVGLIIAGAALDLSGAEDTILSALSALFGNSSADLSSINYRRQLLDEALALVKQQPWSGVPNYQFLLGNLMQGEGIIDIVNTYIVILINTGVIGLSLFLLPYVIVIGGLLRAMPARRDLRSDGDGRAFAVAFVAVTIASLIAIFTSSAIGVIPFLLLLLLALPRAWLAMTSAERAALPPDDQARPSTARTRLGMGGIGNPVLPVRR